MSGTTPELIVGASFSDERGTLLSFNGFNMAPVRRMYWITPSSEGQIRAWQGHQRERKWFYCLDGHFEVKLIKVDDFENPSPGLAVLTFELDAAKSQVLFIPGGYVNGFKALREQSRLGIFSDCSLEDSLNDDFRFHQDYWDVWQS